MISELLNSPVAVAFVAGIPAMMVAVFGYRKSMRLDRKAETVAAAALQAGRGEVFTDGLINKIVSLERENEALRRIAAAEP